MCTDVKDRFISETFSFKNFCVEKACLVLSDFGRKFNGRMEIVSLFNEQVNFLFATIQAYFKTTFFSGDRPGDLGQDKVPEILRFPNNDGFLFGEKPCGRETKMFLESDEPHKQLLNYLSHQSNRA